MSNLKEILVLADKFEKLAQTMSNSAQAADVEDALRAAGLFNNIGPKISPMVDQARVPETAKVSVSVIVDKNLNVSFSVEQNPPGPSSTTLANIFKKNFAGLMKKALMDAKINVADVITAKWINF